MEFVESSIEEEVDCNNNEIKTFSIRIDYFNSINEFFFSFYTENFSLNKNLKAFQEILKEIAQLERNYSRHKRIKQKVCYVEIKDDHSTLTDSLSFKSNIRIKILNKTNELPKILFGIISQKNAITSKNYNEVLSKLKKDSENKLLLGDLITKMLKDELLIQIEKIIEHPLFWNPKQKIEFFIEAHKFFKRKNISEEIINQLEMFNTNYFSQSTEGSIAPVISCDMYEEVEIDGEWINIKDIGHRGKDFEKMKTIQNYLKFFRDMWNHADDEKYPVRGKWLGYNAANGKLDQEIFWNHITQPCPQLLLSIYNKFYEQIKEFTT